MMHPPNIAKVHDAGATDTGRPYFVMERVRGIPVTKYCDDKHLTPTARLELFIKIGQAVQHAQQKGIIHRDLKPSNILVTVNDGEPTPKVIDWTRPPTPAPDYSSGMPHSPAAMSRRFILDVMGTAPSSFSRRRQPAKVVGAFFTALGGTRSILCLIRVVFVARFEVADGIPQCFVETQVAQPDFFAQIPSGGQEVLVCNAVSRVKARKYAIAIVRARHQSHNKGDHLALNGGEIHRDVTRSLEPDDERFVAHCSTRATGDHPILSVRATKIRVRKGRSAP